MYKSESLINNFIKNNSSKRRYDFRGAGNYFDFIFLCGKKITDDDTDNRRIIQNRIIKNKFTLLAEDLYRVFDTSNADLLTIEEYLFGISTATILLLESYGTACELGAFSFVDSNIDKLWVFNNFDYRPPNDSFITKGPLTRINNKEKEHVIYQKFDKMGKIVFDSDGYKALLEAGRKTFIKDAVKVEDDVLLINDLGFVVCLFLDYIMTFGFLVERNIMSLLETIYKVSSFKIVLPSKNEMTKYDEVRMFFINCLKILESTKILIKKNNKGTDYYCINYDTLQGIGKKMTDFDSFLFITSFFTKTKDKEISRIKNTAIQEGFKLW